MSTLSASPTELGGSEPPATRRVIDAPTRMLHWLLALSFAGAYLSAESERWHLLHASLGYTVLGLVVWRLVWGLLGPRRSRLGAWFGKLGAAPRQARAWLAGRGDLQASLQPLGALAVLSLLGLALLAGLSGMATELDWLGGWAGDALEELHGAAGELMLMVVLAHLALLLGLSLLKRQNAALPMLTGRMPGRGPDLVKRNLGALAALMLAAVLAFWTWQWLGTPLGQAPLDGRAPAHERHDRDHDDD